MNTIVLYLIKSIFVSGLLTSWYWLGLRNKRLNNYNRFFLLFTLLAGVLVPLFHFQWFTIHSAQSPSTTSGALLLQAINYNGDYEPAATNITSGFPINWSVLAFIFISLVSVAFLTTLLIRIAWVFRMARKYPQTEIEGTILVTTDLPKAPFSFLNYIFWRNNIPLESENGRLILRHELAHIRQKHTCDKLACQLLTCIFWMNPFYWIIQKELNMIHEFIADETAFKENDSEAFARMLLQTHNNGRYLVPEHQFFSSPVKRRLIMLKTSNKTSYSFARRMLVLPLIACTILIFSFTARKDSKTEIVKATKKIILVIDPGHGGSDAGATYGSLVEKDLNLKIANRIGDLASDYNVEVHMTRTGDEYPTLAQRVEFSNALHPDDFISIHVNDVKTDPKTDTGKGNFDLWINMDNTQTEKSKILGWAIFQNISKAGGIQRRNWQTHERLYVCTHNNAPSILVELGDIKNKEDMARINDDIKLDELCNAILRGVVEANKD